MMLSCAAGTGGGTSGFAWPGGGLSDQLRQIAGTRDPEAIRVAGRIMANSWQDYALRVGPGQLPVEQRAFVNAFLVLSCEFGAPCGTDGGEHATAGLAGAGPKQGGHGRGGGGRRGGG